MELKNKRIVLTGASSGIGKRLLEALLEEGAIVFAVSRTIETSLTLVHENLTVKNMDVSTYKGVDNLFEMAGAHLGTIDLFIANAGFTYYEILKSADKRHIDNILDTNTRSVIYSAVKMRELYHDQPFAFMATLSAVSYLSMPGYALYSASKAALRGFFDSFELEFTRSDQQLLRVYPVATKTPFFTRAKQTHKPWPVQSPEHVVRTMIKGLKKDKKHIYPSKLFKWSYKLFPFFYRLYIAKERRTFLNLMKPPKDEGHV